MRTNSNTDSLMNEVFKSDERSGLQQALEEYYDAIEVEGECDVEALVNKYPTVSDKLTRCIQSLGILQTLLPNDSRSDLYSVPPMEALGDFRIVRELGRGGMGIVYEAEQISLDRRVALKVLPFAATLDTNHMGRFKNEARAAAMLKHSNIVSVYSVGCERGVHYIAMELIEGRSLAEEILLDARQHLDSPAAKSSKQFDSGDHADHDRVTVVNGVNTTAKRSQNRFRAIAERAAAIAEALHYAHQTGVVHRDIKPSNLLLDHVGKVYVSDFGLAQIHADNNLTITGDLVGTLRYMSPEQIDGSGIVDHRTDVYSLGLTIYELLARRPAFSETNRHRLIKQISEESPKPLRHMVPTIPADLETIIFRATEKERDLRYQTCQELAGDLRSFINHRPIKARRSSRMRCTWKWFVRNPWIAASLVTFFLLLVIGITSTSWQLRRAIAAEQKNLTELYGSEMQLAFEAWDRGDLGQVESKLKRFSDRNEFSNVRGLEWTFLNRQLQDLSSDSMIQCDGPVRSLAISSDGSRFLSAAKDLRISSWNFATRQKQWSVSGITYPLLTAYSPDGSLVATSSEKELWICDASDGRIVSRIDLGGQLVRHASFVNALDGQAGYDLLIAIASSTDNDGETEEPELFHWIHRDQKMVAVDPQPSGGITALVFSRDRSRVAINDDNNKIGFFDPTTWVQRSQLGQSRGRVRLLAFFDEDRSLVSSPGRVLGSDSRTRFWDVAINKEMFPLPAAETIGKDIVVSPVSKKAAVLGAEPGSFAIWDLSTGESQQVRGHRGQVLCAAWTPDGKTLLTGGEDGTIRFWDVDKHAPKTDDAPVSHVVELILHNQAALTKSTNFDDHSAPSDIKRYALDDGPPRGIRNAEIFGTTRKNAMGFALIDEQTMASCASGGIIEFWNLKTRESRSVKVTESELWPSAMAASSDSNTLAIGRFASGGGKSPVEIVKNVDGEWKLIRTLKMPAWPLCVRFSPDGNTLAGAAYDGSLRLWSMRNGKTVADLPGHADKIWAIRFSPDGKRLATASSDRTVRVWDLDSHECVSILNHFHEVFSLTYSSNGQRLVTGTVQGWLSFWNPDSEQFFGRFQTGDHSIGAIEFSRDGSILIAATVDGDCKLFNLTSR